MIPKHLLALSVLQKELKLGNLSLSAIIESFISLQDNQGDPNNCWETHLTEPPLYANRDKTYAPLDGLMVGVKDNISTSDFPTKMGTDFWASNKGGFDSRVVATLKRRGAVIVGKTKCSEFAVHKRTTTLNPRYPECEPGTSSSGSAAAVASGEVSIALGTQTVGSIIKPSSYCGVIGFKPSFGEIPRTGVLKTTELFDTVGFLGRRLEEINAAYLASRVEGGNYPIHTRERSRFMHTPYSSIEVLTGKGVDSPTAQLANKLLSYAESLAENLGLPLKIKVFEEDLLRLRHSFDLIYAKDLAYFLADHKIEDKVSDELLSYMDYGNTFNNDDYNQAKDLIKKWRLQYHHLTDNPLYVSLATSSSAPLVGMPDLIDANLLLTSLGFPQVSLPVLRDDEGKIVNVSLASRKFSDNSLLSLAKIIFPSDALDVKSYLFSSP